jgi:toxin HigB-1
LEIAFANKRLREICESKSKGGAELGTNAYESLKRRLLDIDAAECLSELSWLDMVMINDGSVAISFHSGYRLLAVAGNRSMPRGTEGQVDWNAVDRIKITEIEKL